MKQKNLANLTYNFKVQSYSKGVIALIAGSSAGYLGFQGLYGLYYWCAWSLLGSMIEILKTQGNPDKYFSERTNLVSYVATTYVSLTASLGLTYVLFWTFFYNIIHVYQ
eukprot:NODE_2_length_91304_cov_0.692462.p80 type:complete len:109 gc:universal NODE_2_length_91304_cov_0.692462:29380-29706(+)